MDLLSKAPLKGMLDEYYEDMLLYNWIADVVGKTAQLNGFYNYDTPILEPMDIFLKKSSEELLKEQSYNLIDKGERHLLLRPELTPSLARMVSNFYKERPKPFKLFSIAKCFRYERPQKGRLREFKQANFDIIAQNPPIQADLEILLLVANIFDAFKIPVETYRIHYSFRNIFSRFLESIKAPSVPEVLKTVDKKLKVSHGEFRALLEEQLNPEQTEAVLNYLDAPSPSDFLKEYLPHEESLLNEINFFDGCLSEMGLKPRLTYSPHVVRGLDYYTGIVFEVFSTSEDLRRSLFGGGRYDNLLSNYVQESLSGVGFAFGIPILTLFLEELGLLPSDLHPETCQIFYLGRENIPFAFRVAKVIQSRYGYSTEVRQHTGSLKKVFSHFPPHVRHLCIVGDEERRSLSFRVRELASKQETLITL